MPNINFQNERFRVPDRVNGVDLRRALGVQPDEIPVRVDNNGNMEPIPNNNSEYFLPDESTIDTIHNLKNG